MARWCSSPSYPWLAPLFLLLSCLTGPAQGVQPGAQEVGNPASDAENIYIEVDAFGQDLELLRQVMGRPGLGPLDIDIHSSAPHDIYFQALTTLQRVNQLSFEISRVREAPPSLPVMDIGLADILTAVRGSHQILKRVMADLQIAPSMTLPVGDAARTLGDVFMGILAINRQLDLLLECHFDASDIYREITLAVGYASRILAYYPEATRLPESPPFEPAKQPRDVYLRLIECLDIIARVFKALGLEGSHIQAQQSGQDVSRPGDVFLVACLVVSQLDFLHKQLGIARMPPEVFYPGHKFPSHSYQRAGLLEAQLAHLEHLVANKATLVQ